METVSKPLNEAQSLRLTFTIDEAAAMLGISRPQAYDGAKRGEIPTIRIGRRILVPRIGLAQMLGMPEGAIK
jgi:excisionase family DNA binding protein